MDDKSLGISLSLAGTFLFLCLSFGLNMSGYGRWSFASALLMTILLDAFLWLSVIAKDTRCLPLKAAFVFCWIYKFFPFALCFSLPISEDYLFPFWDVLFGSPVESALGQSIPTVSVAIVYLITQHFIPRRSSVEIQSIRQVFQGAGPHFEAFLIFAGVIKFLQHIAVLGLDNPIFYFVRIAGMALYFVPFFVGLTAFQYKRSTIVWLIVLGLGVVASYLTGSRGTAFYPILYFLVGFAIGLPNWRTRIRWGIFAVFPICIFLFVTAVNIGAARDVLGRRSIVAALSGENLMGEAGESFIQAKLESDETVAFKAFRRLTSWPAYAIPPMTPENVPYRGFGDFPYQVRSAFTLGITAMLSDGFRGAYYFDNLFLVPYGFSVGVDAAGRKYTNVEFPLHVAAFTRGGWIAAFTMTILAFVVVYIVNQKLRKYLIRKYYPVYLMMITFLCYIAAVRFTKASFVDSMRQLVLEGTFTLVILLAFFYFMKNVLGVRQRSSLRAPRSRRLPV
ncbi:hypothetical protein G0Q06_11290 [Puniceicoccales bacterium CK1056]|uniref:Uncharacterized protein n=1 Tax=Oceanipulchritudo coccoides TaxID=2706888 RepID=A0A6B2M274_9BACT|nr:hypothetical protein [Oceanipulchritudo coccoides]NDV63038.1 hypothetical protein [Oceanipulchritudo coccoides]